jgi:2-polyprenyl-3-methyl-5-hydroxy-6-metoxy-1,4-benzoquinol methylase
VTPGRPRSALFLFDCADPQALAATIARIPPDAAARLAEVVAMAGREPGFGPEALGAGEERPFGIRVVRQPHETGYGGARKAALEHALLEGFDVVVLLRGDGSQPPEALPALLAASLDEGQPLVLASRLADRRGAVASGMPLARLSAHTLATGLMNRVLGLRVRDYLTSYRVLHTRPLRRLPFALDADDRVFDQHLLIQLRALGITPREVPVRAAWREDDARREELAHVLRATVVSVGYRLHQLHVIRRGRYFVDKGIHYTFKWSEHGSHMQIVGLIRPDTRMLDLGCSQGLLARPLRERGVRVVGVDGCPADENLAEELEDYLERDLELPLEIPKQRDFDYVVCADVIEHLKNRAQLLRGARRYLKPDGRLIISTGNIAIWFYRLSLLAGRFNYGPRGILDRDHAHLYTRDSFRREVEAAGFRVVAERVTSLPFEVVFESTGRSRLVRGLSASYHLLARAWPELFAYQVILEAEITTLDEDAVRPQGG